MYLIIEIWTVIFYSITGLSLIHIYSLTLDIQAKGQNRKIVFSMFFKTVIRDYFSKRIKRKKNIYQK